MDGDKRFCKACGAETPQVVTLRPAGVHYADSRCAVCGLHCGFLSKPDDEPTKYKRPAAHRELVAKFSRGFCELCLTPEAALPKGQTLEAQHVVEFADGGAPLRENVWIICTGCHRLIHWRRTYCKGGGDV
jgi:hypothetical protein